MSSVREKSKKEKHANVGTSVTIWQFFGLWATFYSIWQQLICPNLLTFIGNFCTGVKIYHFYSEIIFRQLLQTFGDFYLVTLPTILFKQQFDVNEFVLRRFKFAKHLQPSN